MTRNEVIEHWKPIIYAVFTADAAIIDGWKDRLKEAAKNGESIKALDEYLTAVAVEILSRTSDEELEKMGGEP